SLTAPSLSSSHHLPTTEIYTLSLHDALPISLNLVLLKGCAVLGVFWGAWVRHAPEQYKAALDELVRWCVQGRLSCHIQQVYSLRSEEHTSELQSRFDLVCRLLLEKNKAGSEM